MWFSFSVSLRTAVKIRIVPNDWMYVLCINTRDHRLNLRWRLRNVTWTNCRASGTPATSWCIYTFDVYLRCSKSTQVFGTKLLKGQWCDFRRQENHVINVNDESISYPNLSFSLNITRVVSGKTKLFFYDREKFQQRRHMVSAWPKKVCQTVRSSKFLEE